ncbi:hypothetical protein HYH03_000655 [Edaphochlamys debaryana]|uniref:Uncharacterized protein n=1 Tax=Edaphochlamys debaryana TaxID=47281 RepID=A0A836C7E3_9CHLO|nr:hypothetical protein HYH03_000655 [Edaphochlamys debaryana]|eukprot:KAG2502168.1 hypothetical protein HYH03_000655 [Edaphochlamys debaryana]
MAYLMARGGLSLEDARAAVKAARPLVNPNQGFALQLQAFQDAGCSVEGWQPWTLDRFLQLRAMAFPNRFGGDSTAAPGTGGAATVKGACDLAPPELSREESVSPSSSRPGTPSSSPSKAPPGDGGAMAAAVETGNLAPGLGLERSASDGVWPDGWPPGRQVLALGGGDGGARRGAPTPPGPRGAAARTSSSGWAAGAQQWSGQAAWQQQQPPPQGRTPPLPPHVSLPPLAMPPPQTSPRQSGLGAHPSPSGRHTVSGIPDASALAAWSRAQQHAQADASAPYGAAPQQVSYSTMLYGSQRAPAASGWPQAGQALPQAQPGATYGAEVARYRGSLGALGAVPPGTGQGSAGDGFFANRHASAGAIGFVPPGPEPWGFPPTSTAHGYASGGPPARASTSGVWAVDQASHTATASAWHAAVSSTVHVPPPPRSGARTDGRGPYSFPPQHPQQPQQPPISAQQPPLNQRAQAQAQGLTGHAGPSGSATGTTGPQLRTESSTDSEFGEAAQLGRSRAGGSDTPMPLGGRRPAPRRIASDSLQDMLARALGSVMRPGPGATDGQAEPGQAGAPAPSPHAPGSVPGGPGAAAAAQQRVSTDSGASSALAPPPHGDPSVGDRSSASSSDSSNTSNASSKSAEGVGPGTGAGEAASSSAPESSPATPPRGTGTADPTTAGGGGPRSHAPSAWASQPVLTPADLDRTPSRLGGGHGSSRGGGGSGGNGFPELGGDEGPIRQLFLDGPGGGETGVEPSHVVASLLLAHMGGGGGGADVLPPYVRAEPEIATSRTASVTSSPQHVQHVVHHTGHAQHGGEAEAANGGSGAAHGSSTAAPYGRAGSSRASRLASTTFASPDGAGTGDAAALIPAQLAGASGSTGGLSNTSGHSSAGRSSLDRTSVPLGGLSPPGAYNPALMPPPPPSAEPLRGLTIRSRVNSRKAEWGATAAAAAAGGAAAAADSPDEGEGGDERAAGTPIHKRVLRSIVSLLGGRGSHDGGEPGAAEVEAIESGGAGGEGGGGGGGVGGIRSSVFLPPALSGMGSPMASPSGWQLQPRRRSDAGGGGAGPNDRARKLSRSGSASPTVAALGGGDPAAAAWAAAAAAAAVSANAGLAARESQPLSSTSGTFGWGPDSEAVLRAPGGDESPDLLLAGVLDGDDEGEEDVVGLDLLPQEPLRWGGDDGTARGGGGGGGAPRRVRFGPRHFSEDGSARASANATARSVWGRVGVGAAPPQPSVGPVVLAAAPVADGVGLMARTSAPVPFGVGRGFGFEGAVAAASAAAAGPEVGPRTGAAAAVPRSTTSGTTSSWGSAVALAPAYGATAGAGAGGTERRGRSSYSGALSMLHAPTAGAAGGLGPAAGYGPSRGSTGTASAMVAAAFAGGGTVAGGRVSASGASLPPMMSPPSSGWPQASPPLPPGVQVYRPSGAPPLPVAPVQAGGLSSAPPSAAFNLAQLASPQPSPRPDEQPPLPLQYPSHPPQQEAPAPRVSSSGGGAAPGTSPPAAFSHPWSANSRSSAALATMASATPEPGPTPAPSQPHPPHQHHALHPQWPPSFSSEAHVEPPASSAYELPSRLTLSVGPKPPAPAPSPPSAAPTTASALPTGVRATVRSTSVGPSTYAAAPSFGGSSTSSSGGGAPAAGAILSGPGGDTAGAVRVWDPMRAARAMHHSPQHTHSATAPGAAGAYAAAVGAPALGPGSPLGRSPGAGGPSPPTASGGSPPAHSSGVLSPRAPPAMADLPEPAPSPALWGVLAGPPSLAPSNAPAPATSAAAAEGLPAGAADASRPRPDPSLLKPVLGRKLLPMPSPSAILASPASTPRATRSGGGVPGPLSPPMSPPQPQQQPTRSRASASAVPHHTGGPGPGSASPFATTGPQLDPAAAAHGSARGDLHVRLPHELAALQPPEAAGPSTHSTDASARQYPVPGLCSGPGLSSIVSPPSTLGSSVSTGLSPMADPRNGDRAGPGAGVVAGAGAAVRRDGLHLDRLVVAPAPGVERADSVRSPCKMGGSASGSEDGAGP